MSGDFPNIKVYIRPQSTFDVGGTFTLGASALNTGTLGAPVASFYEVPGVQSVSTRRGRTRITDTFDTGSATVSIVDSTGIFNPDNLSSPINGYVKPMRQIRITATVSGLEYPLFSGYINSIRYDYIKGFDYAQVSIEAFDLMRLLSMLEITTVTGEAFGDDSGERIGKILSTAGVPSSLTNINAGISLLDSDPGTERNVQAAIQQCESSEAGAFFITSSGLARFYDRHTVQFLAHEVGYTALELDDTPLTTDNINYTEVSQSIDDQILYNDVTVEPSVGSPQQATDASSIDEYFRRTYSRGTTLISSEDEALQHANFLLNAWKQPQLIVGDISLNGRQLDAAKLQELLSVDLLHPIKISKTYTSATAVIQRTLTLQGVSHTISPSSWAISVAAAEPVTDEMAFILGSSFYQIVDENDDPLFDAIRELLIDENGNQLVDENGNRLLTTGDPLVTTNVRSFITDENGNRIVDHLGNPLVDDISLPVDGYGVLGTNRLGF